jgi:hypothetical protein
MTPSPEQQALIDAAVRVLSADRQVEAVWLAGSLGRAAGDAFSDVDLLALVVGEAPALVGQRYVRAVAQIATPVLVTPLFGGRVVSVVTADWRRFDLSFVDANGLGPYNAAHLSVLFNKGGKSPPTLEPAPYEPSPEVVLGLVNEFFRVLGLSVVGVGREEWVLSLSGAEILRRLTVDLMLEENRISPAERGGALHRKPLLTAQQNAALESLTPVSATREGVLNSNRELAAVFLPRARTLAERIGAKWPAALEDATRAHLWSRLGLRLD